MRVERWRRYGKDRLYVNGADGRRLGWCDLTTGALTVDDEAQRAVVVDAVERWRAASGDPVPAASAASPRATVPRPASVTTPPSSPETPSAPAWEDLAQRRAGQEARERAIALKQQAPVRTFLARALGVHTAERAWRVGADGEEKVAARLARLVAKDPRWRVLHAVPVGENGSDIDHVVIGPGGVFTLNAKHHPGGKVWVAGSTFMVNGRRLPYLRNSSHEAARASRLLSAAAGLPVTAVGVVVLVGVQDMTVRAAPEGAEIVYRRRLASWLRRRPEVLDQTAVDRIFEAARRSTTWVR